MIHTKQTRRNFLKTSAGALAAGATTPYIFTANADEGDKPKSKNDRFRIGAIGMKYQGTRIAKMAELHGDVVAICDVDRQIAEKAKEDFGGKADLYEDYRKMFERKDLDVITIGAPDHWHTAMAVDACRTGFDVYCEKPLTLTIDEGKLLCKVVKETGRVFQVGTWQRSTEQFRLACEMVRAGRIGKLRKVTVTLSKNETGGPFKIEQPPAYLNWDLWLGQTPKVPYIKERCHYTFRWWYEYSGGQMTDWGAHHVDIAQWGMGMDNSGPVEIDGRAKFPHIENGYNVAIDFEVKMIYPNGVELAIKDHGRTGVMFEGSQGRIFVNRRLAAGKPVDQLKDNPFPKEQFKLYPHDNFREDRKPFPWLTNHMGNFFDCIKTRNTPISDVVSQHRSVSVCHLGNISMRLGRKLKWDPEKELFVGDDEANGMLSREQHKPYQIEA